jgi:transposase
MSQRRGQTGLRIGGRTQLLQVVSTAMLTFYRVCAKRGNLLMNVDGIVVHDHWKPYYTMPGVLHVCATPITCAN